MNKIYGYIRVSSKDQNEDRQRASLAEWNIKPRNVFMDKQSGKDFDRPQWQRLMKKLNLGDLLVVSSIDRLGRNYDEILEQWRIITKDIGADIVVLDFPLLDTRVSDRNLTGIFIADLTLQILAYVAQIERENIKKRQAEGIAAAKARGVSFGRKKMPLPDNFNDDFHKWRLKEISTKELEERCGMNRASIYRRLRQAGIPLNSYFQDAFLFNDPEDD